MPQNPEKNPNCLDADTQFHGPYHHICAAGSRRLRGEAIQASENRNNFNPIQHTTRRPGAAAPVVDTNAWQHEKLHFHPTAPPSPQLQQDRFNRSVGILALRSDRIANEGRPPSKRFQNSVSETLNWHYPKPSSPGIDASPLRSSFVGKAMAWREHDPAQCRCVSSAERTATCCFIALIEYTKGGKVDSLG